MVDPLSIVASIGVVVGLADAILGASKKLYNFLKSVREAPSQIQALMQALKTWESISQDIKSVGTRYQLSPFFYEDSLDFGNVLETLIACQNEMTELQLSLAKRDPAPTRRLSKLVQNVQWTFDNKKLLASIESLERAKLSLVIALSNLGSQNDISLRIQAEATRADISEFQDCAIGSFRSLGEVLKASQDRTDGRLQQFNQNVKVYATQVSEQFSWLKASIQSGTSAAKSSTLDLQAQGATIQKSVERLESGSASGQASLHEHVTQSINRLSSIELDTQALVRKNLVVSRNIRHKQARIDRNLALRSESAQATSASMSISRAETNGCQLEIYGGDLQSVIMPLMLMNTGLVLVVDELSCSGELHISQYHANLFLSQLEELLATFHYVAAVELLRPRRSRLPLVSKPTKSSSDQFLTVNELGPKPVSSASRQRRRIWRRGLSSGVLVIEIEGYMDDSIINLVSNAVLIHFHFIPHFIMGIKGLSASFRAGIRAAKSPRSFYNFRTFSLVPRESLVCETIRHNDTRALQELMSKREVTPWDRVKGDLTDESIFAFAAHEGAADVFLLFLEQGAEVYDTGMSGRNILEDVWIGFNEAGCMDSSTGTSGKNPIAPDNYIEMFNSAIRYGASTENFFTKSRGLGDFSHLASSMSSKEELRGVLECFRSHGHDTEGRDLLGRTALLSAAAQVAHTNSNYGYWLQLLVEGGADTSATDFRSSSGDLHLKDCISVLLRAACDPDLKDSFGDTPSQYMQHNWLPGLWEDWELILKKYEMCDRVNWGYAKGRPCRVKNFRKLDWNLKRDWCYVCDGPYDSRPNSRSGIITSSDDDLSCSREDLQDVEDKLVGHTDKTALNYTIPRYNDEISTQIDIGGYGSSISSDDGGVPLN